MENVVRTVDVERSRFLGRTYGWMALALLISAVSALVSAISVFNANGQLSVFGKFLYGGRFGFIVLALAELGLVWYLSAAIRRISVTAASIGFIVYSVLNGVTLSSILFIYQLESIFAAFFSCSAMFLVMCIYGATTKRNLATIGRYCMMGLFGIVVATVVQFGISFFTKTDFRTFDLLISILTVVVFTGLTMWDAQKVQRAAEYSNGSDDYKKVAIIGALELYLDFINLFLAILRIFGRRR